MAAVRPGLCPARVLFQPDTSKHHVGAVAPWNDLGYWRRRSEHGTAAKEHSKLENFGGHGHVVAEIPIHFGKLGYLGQMSAIDLNNYVLWSFVC